MAKSIGNPIPKANPSQGSGKSYAKKRLKHNPSVSKLSQGRDRGEVLCPIHIPHPILNLKQPIIQFRILPYRRQITPLLGRRNHHFYHQPNCSARHGNDGDNASRGRERYLGIRGLQGCRRVSGRRLCGDGGLLWHWIKGSWRRGGDIGEMGQGTGETGETGGILVGDVVVVSY